MFKRILEFCKKEIVLMIALLLAAVSAIFVHPDKEYLGYIDMRTLAILFCLMAVMAGLQKIGFFDFIAEALLQRVKQMKGLILLLVMLCFFSSMLITNDVALITFVPFTFIVLKLVLREKAEKLLVPIIVLQTVAANLGSMLTPIGNPQNLYLYGLSGLGLWEFLKIVLPYASISFVLLAGICTFYPYTGEKEIVCKLEQKTSLGNHKKELVIYAILFLISVLSVAHIIPYGYAFMVVALAITILDKKVLLSVDYNLLLTFVGFFVFIGNMGRVPAFYLWLQKIIEGNEVAVSVAASQFMSNVPAALLLSGFTNRFDLLIIGTNLGGLGTMIASMASLISFKYVGRDYAHLRGRYFGYFTVVNILFLAVLLAYRMMFAG